MSDSSRATRGIVNSINQVNPRSATWIKLLESTLVLRPLLAKVEEKQEKYLFSAPPLLGNPAPTPGKSSRPVNSFEEKSRKERFPGIKLLSATRSKRSLEKRDPAQNCSKVSRKRAFSLLFPDLFSKKHSEMAPF